MLELVCMYRQGVCIRSHMISLLREAIFHTYHANTDKEDARPPARLQKHTCCACEEQSPP